MLSVEQLEACIQQLDKADFYRLKDWFHGFEQSIDIEQCPISGMTKSESMQLSRDMAKSLRQTDYSQAKLIKA